MSGGSSGIGLATARLLLSEGAHVTICGRSRDRLTDAVDELGELERVHAVAVDITSQPDCARAVAAAVDATGRLDGIAAVAGQGLHGTLTKLSVSQMAEEVSNKAMGLLHLIDAAFPHLREVGGRVVALTAPTHSNPTPLWQQSAQGALRSTTWFALSHSSSLPPGSASMRSASA